MRLNRRQLESPFVPSPGTTLKSVVSQLRLLAARQREIAAAVPQQSLRESFLASAERIESQAQAELRRAARN